ncbi:MAG: Dabb family protein [Phycisphaeraceae bacterium]|nr:Dabb family protein [Phycisphaeraceae bacterium]
MVEHMVWIKFRPGVTPQRVQEHLTGLAGLIKTVPGVKKLSIGPNFTDRANGFTHGLLVTLGSREALQTYQVHPEHVKVAGPLRQDAELMAMDIEV